MARYWMQDFEFQLCQLLRGTTLHSLDQTDIETLFDFAAYIAAKNGQETKKRGGTVTINGKVYRKVDTFSARD